jgi:hypothetical protein
MFEPLKFISVGLTLILLAPFGFVFWLLATTSPKPEAVRRAQLEAAMREERARVGTTNADGSIVVGVGITIRESLAFSPGTASWLSFYPRRWVGWLGLAAIGIIAFCIVLSLFFPGPSAVSDSAWHDSPPSAQTPTP